MRIPANNRYFFSRKANDFMPDYFNHYLLNSNVGNYYAENIERFRNVLLESQSYVYVQDFGAGSRISNKSRKRISEIVRISSIPYKYGLFFTKLVLQFKPSRIIEFGTSMGIGTAFLAAESTYKKIVSIEACESTILCAKKNFSSLGLQNIELINDTFDNVIESNIIEEKFDLIYIDGNHRGDALLRYYNYFADKLGYDKCIFIIDDINWSLDMFSAWKFIAKINSQACVVDLYRMGIVFLNYIELPVGYYPLEFANNFDCKY